MQTVMNSVLSPSQSPSKSTKGVASQESESRHHLFAENLQKAKQGLASDNKAAASDRSSENLQKAKQGLASDNKAAASDRSSENVQTSGNKSPIGVDKASTGLLEKAATSVADAKSNQQATDDKTSQESVRRGSEVTLPEARSGDHISSTANLEVHTDSEGNSSQSMLPDSGNTLHHVGQNTPKSATIEKSNTAALDDLSAATKLTQENGAPTLSQTSAAAVITPAESTKTANRSTVPSAVSTNQLGIQSNTQQPAVNSDVLPLTSDANKESLTVAPSTTREVKGPINGVLTSVSGDAQQSAIGEGESVELVNSVNATGAENALQLAPATGVSALASDVDGGHSSLVNNGENLAQPTQQTLPLGDEIKPQDGTLKENKIPPEVRALLASEGGVKGVDAGLASLGLAAKVSAESRHKTAANNAGESLSMAGGTTTLTSTEPADTGELSWVLSQMGGGPSAEQASPLKDQSVVASTGTTKIAEQVALANEAKSAQSLVAAPVTLAGLAASKTDQSSTTDGLDSAVGADTLLSNEPLELRKKEQDALLGKMASQFDGVAKEADTGGLNSSISSAANITSRTAPAAPHLQTMNTAQNLAMSVPPNHPGWAGEMSQKVAFVAQSGGHTAHIKLDPPELGSLTVKVSVDSDNNNAQVSFVAATPQARDLLESQIGRLRDMLAQQGMDLGNVDVGVSQQDASGGQYQDSGEAAGRSHLGGFLADEEVDDELPAQNISYISPSGVDYYA
ncbi:flagellar hook-length control protein FliK [Marinomonas pollencensis]|uniref:Flagellar hook-length control protein FliK n=1 Tax=Marinomonas pollencensis TaxID=491954 RepID=A0A3E0DJS7_9GAMM|nr:flagellar hook-length control protein FliK [Marinomonas pollencensis]REG82936.1 flagellar hook-length control protein FliK [Marinomonas pollencensis]